MSEPASTYKCTLDPDFHFKVFRSSGNGYCFEVCDTCGYIFKLESAPELVERDAELKESKAFIAQQDITIAELRVERDNEVKKHAETAKTVLEFHRKLAASELLNAKLREALEKYDKALVLAVSIIKCGEKISGQAGAIFIDAMRSKETLSSSNPSELVEAYQRLEEAATKARGYLVDVDAIPYYAYGDNQAANVMKTAIMDSLTVVREALDHLSKVKGAV